MSVVLACALQNSKIYDIKHVIFWFCHPVLLVKTDGAKKFQTLAMISAPCPQRQTKHFLTPQYKMYCFFLFKL